MGRTFRATGVLLSIHIFCALLLGFAIAAKYVNPNVIVWMPFVGLAYPYLVFLQLLFGGYWLLRKKKHWRISLTVLLIGLGTFVNFFQISFADDLEKKDVKIMSYNVRLFDLYNWTENKTTRNKIFELLQKEEADILCFQEFFYSEKPTYFKTLDTLLQLQKAKNVHTLYNSTKHQVHHFGLATFSVYPIVQKGRVDLHKDSPANNDCIFTDLKVGKDTVRIYNFHLASIHFGKEDYKFLEGIGDKQTNEQIKGSKQILRRLKRAFQKRAKQAELIAAHIAESPYPVVVCGDLNDTPSSYAYHTLSANLKDGFVEKGSGIGSTYNGLFPAFRIDYILHSNAIVTKQFNTIKKPYSDHYPVTAVFGL